MKTRNRQKVWSLLIALAMVIGAVPWVAPRAALAGSTYFTTTDNENNAGTGTADGDLDLYFDNSDSRHPIEFNINVTTAPGGSVPTYLAIRAEDVDEESGEIDYVYLNDPTRTSAIGHLSGANNVWSTTLLDVTGAVNAGDNRVDITIADNWMLEVDWGQIIIDGGGEEQGSITSLSASGSDWSTITVTVETTTTVGSFALDVNLIDSSTNNVDLYQTTFTSGGSDTFSNTMSTQVQPASGDEFVVQAILSDATTGYIYHIQQTTWRYASDTDGDGIPDDVEGSATNRDTDGDGVPDYQDLDSDNDGINDVIEAGGTDADGDGQHDGALGELTNPPDTDGDGADDYVDLDSDNDSISDLVEGGSGATDADGNGVADGPDADGDGIVDDADGLPNTFGDSGDPGPKNSDGTAPPDYIDTDSDDDGTDDIDAYGNGDLDTNDDGMIDDATDVDNDGIADNVDGDDTVFGGLGALTVTKVAGDVDGPPLYPGDTITYAVDVVNYSTVTHTNVIVTDTLPIADVTFDAATPGGYGGPNPLVWSAGTLPPNGTWSAVITVTIKPGVTTLGGNVAAVSSDQQEKQDTGAVRPPDGGDVTPLADLAVSKEYEVFFISNVTFTVAARNLGPESADGAVVTDVLPATITGTTWSCVAAGGASCTASGTGDVSDTLTSFPAGGVVTYTIAGTFESWDYFSNTAHVSPPAGVDDNNDANNHATVERYLLFLMPIFREYTQP
jgi:uncharacterized repeat protein (TIGR01451 family)